MMQPPGFQRPIRSGLTAALVMLASLLSAEEPRPTGSESMALSSACRFPVAVDGSAPGIEYVEIGPEAMKKVGFEYEKGPIIPYGTRRIVYTLIDMANAVNVQSQNDVDHLMGLAEAYFERMSHGRMDVDLTSAGRVTIPVSNESTCDWYGWAAAVDARVGQHIDLYQFDGRIYFFPGRGSCLHGGMGTLNGNWELPIYTGGTANQSWIMNAFDEFTIVHEMGHNFGLHHGNTAADSSDPDGEEYGDRSTIMGHFNFDLSPYNDELRGIHGVNRAFLGWLEPLIHMDEGIYTVYASELDHPPGPQAFAIPHPAYSRSHGIDWAFFLTYRNGSDGIMADGSFAPLLDEYTRGVGVRLANLLEPDATYLYRVLWDGEYFFFTDPLHEEHRFFSIRQLSHDHEKVTFELDFHPGESEESLAAGTCNNQIDDDGDWKMDFGGGWDPARGSTLGPEGAACAMSWDSIVALPSVKLGDELVVVCSSEFAQVPVMGPQGAGLVRTIREAGGRYIGHFDSSTCGIHTFTCGGEDPDTFMVDHLEATVEVTCPLGRACFDGSCVAYPVPPSTSFDE